MRVVDEMCSLAVDEVALATARLEEAVFVTPDLIDEASLVELVSDVRRLSGRSVEAWSDDGRYIFFTYQPAYT